MTDTERVAQDDAAQVAAVRVELGDRSYSIMIGNGLLDAADSYRGLPAASHCAIVTNEMVGPLYVDRLAAALTGLYREVHLIVLPDGEAHKNFATLQRIFDALLSAHCDRSTTVFALGGGVIGDLAGFAAASYMRGVPFVQVPTTLLAQVDSSVGGKTGLNHPLGKNMIGAFYQPQRVLIDLGVLRTLPDRELQAGIAEVIKTALVADADFFAWLEIHLDALLARDAAALRHAIGRCCEIKAAIVGQDERESDLRAVLNLGHTFGHAIEAGLGYGEWLHGEAVGCGMVMAAHLSSAMGLLDVDAVGRIERVVARAGLPVRGPALGSDAYMALMRRDKKAQGGEIRFVLLESIGGATLRAAPDELVAAVLATCTSGVRS